MKSSPFFFFFLSILPVFSLFQTTQAEEPLIVLPARESITLSGYTRSDTKIVVSSEVTGKVIRVHYDVGEVVGEKPFFEIDPTFIDFQIQSTRQSLKKLEAGLQKNASLVAYLEKEFRRIDKLHKGDRATEVKRDAAAEELDQARLERQTIEAEKGVLSTALKELKERRRRHRIHAPEGWVVIRKTKEIGEFVGAGTPLAEVGDFRRLVIPLSVSGRELSAIRALPPVFVAMLEGEPVRTGLNWVNPEFNEQTRKLGIELILADDPGEKRGGLKLTLPLEIEAEGLWIPKAAVLNRYENPRVKVLSNGEEINVMVLGESDGHLIISHDDRLGVGTELARP